MFIVSLHSMHVKPQRRHTDEGPVHPEQSGSDPTIIFPQNRGISDKDLESHPDWAKKSVKAFFRAFDRSEYYTAVPNEHHNNQSTTAIENGRSYRVASTFSGRNQVVADIQILYGSFTKSSESWIRITAHTSDGFINVSKEWRRNIAKFHSQKPRRIRHRHHFERRRRNPWSGRRPKWRKFGVHFLHILQQHERAMVVHHVMET